MEDRKMAKETKVWEILKEAGYEPLENRSIIVSYAPEDLSDAIAKFLSVGTEFYVLQICREEVVLVPFGKMTWGLKKEVALSIPFAQIKGIKIEKKGLNDYLTIETQDSVIRLSTQQKGLSDLRSSSYLGGQFGKNWHKKNLDATLEELRKIGG